MKMTRRTCQMNGCLGDVSKTGPYVTDECQTIELALKELQIHIDTYHEKDLKKRLKWEFPSCFFVLLGNSFVECHKETMLSQFRNFSSQAKRICSNKVLPATDHR